MAHAQYKDSLGQRLRKAAVQTTTVVGGGDGSSVHGQQSVSSEEIRGLCAGLHRDPGGQPFRPGELHLASSVAEGYDTGLLGVRDFRISVISN